MRILVRADASRQIGVGHVMRCLTLAEALRQQGGEATFVCRELPGNLCEFLEQRGTVRVLRLPAPAGKATPAAEDVPQAPLLGVDWQTDARQVQDLLASELPIDWLVVDHYSLDRRWEQLMRHAARRIMALDDVADRPHDCDLLLDQNLWDAPEDRYDGLIPSGARGLFGPQYALLRPEFAAARATSAARDGAIRRGLVFFGGTDPTNETSKALEALRLLGRDELAIDVVIGAQHPQREQITAQVASLSGARLHVQTSAMARLMADADLALGAGGSASWERCCLGLPALMVSVAPNQEGIAEACDRHGAGIYLGPAPEVTAHGLHEALRDQLASPGKVKRLAERAALLVDGQGVSRVIEAMAT